MAELPLFTIANKPSYLIATKDVASHAIGNIASWTFSDANNGRSTIKTHFLHDGICSIVETALGTAKSPFYEKAVFASEQFGIRSGTVKRLGKSFEKALGKEYQSDLYIKPNKGDGAYVFAAKAALASIAKNETNYINGFIGEIAQFFGAPSNANNKLVLFNLRPRRCFKIEGKERRLAVETVPYAPFSDESGRLHSDYANSLSKRAYEQTICVNVDFDWAADLELSTFTCLKEFAKAIENHPTLGIDRSTMTMTGLASLVTDIVDNFGL